VAEPARHPDLATPLAVGAQGLAQPEHARRRRDLAHASARIGGSRRQAEELRVREDAAFGVDVPRDADVRFAIAVEVHGLGDEIELDVAIPGEPDVARPVPRVRVHGASHVGHGLVRPDVLQGLVQVGRGAGAGPIPWINDVFYRARGRDERGGMLAQGLVAAPLGRPSATADAEREQA